MQLFIDKGIFVKDHKKGLPIRELLRVAGKENKLQLFSHIKVVGKHVNRNWYFTRP